MSDNTVFKTELEERINKINEQRKRDIRARSLRL